MHRNTFIDSPALLNDTLVFRQRRSLLFGGQITGTEGYLASAASGLVAGMNAARLALEQEPLVFPKETMIGALCHYVSHSNPNHFQPMKPNFGILPPLCDSVRGKGNRRRAFVERAVSVMSEWTSDQAV
jgi:methylenetetrahydrofolate--tRNA-(uracil-5-)-methyltransferase